MISEYINPQQALGDFYLSACEKPTLNLPYNKNREALSDGERNANLTTIVEYAAEFVSSIEVAIKPKFSFQYIENYNIIARTILNRDVPENEHFKQAIQQFDQLVSLLSGNNEYDRIGVHLRDYEESYGKGPLPNQVLAGTTNLVEIGFSIAWGAYRISKGKTAANTVEVIKHSVLGALKGAMISDYRGILGGAISHGLIAQSMGIREARLIASNLA